MKHNLQSNLQQAPKFNKDLQIELKAATNREIGGSSGVKQQHQI